VKFSSKKWIPAVIAIAMLVSVACTGCKKKAPDPFPAAGAIAGWEKTSETRVFAAKDLWQYIDGDAEQYISAGVVSTSTSDYKYQGQLEAVIDVYTMGNAEGARKILEK
jgi:predicted small lipoprotein YifL